MRKVERDNRQMTQARYSQNWRVHCKKTVDFFKTYYCINKRTIWPSILCKHRWNM